MKARIHSVIMDLTHSVVSLLLFVYHTQGDMGSRD